MAEEFNQEKLRTKALKWLKMKFPKKDFGFTFKFQPDLSGATKTYNVTIDGVEFDIAGRIFDANGSGKEDPGDVVLFKILPVQDEEETENAF